MICLARVAATGNATTNARSPRRKQKCHPEPAAETMRTGVGRVHSIAHAANDADRLPLYLDNLGD
jgi:hypothetical protein